MSNIYVSEPRTEGKVLLKTTLGDIDIELWPRQAPLACRNFVQHCVDGYYDGVIFHRVIPDFIVQTGDPTGTGFGGDAAYGAPFKDEFHSRLRFTHRGIIAMANTGPNENTSQFFITLSDCEQLNRKNTIFGKIANDTIFNVIKLNDYETDDDDKPLYPPHIISTEVLSSPFEDILPRPEVRERRAREAAQAAGRTGEGEGKSEGGSGSSKAKAKKKKKKKQLNLLSFGDEAAADEEALEEVAVGGTMVSSHDVLDDERLSKETAVKDEELEQFKSRNAAEAAKEKSRSDKIKAISNTVLDADAAKADAQAFAESMKRDRKRKRKDKKEKKSKGKGENGSNGSSATTAGGGGGGGVNGMEDVDDELLGGAENFIVDYDDSDEEGDFATAPPPAKRAKRDIEIEEARAQAKKLKQEILASSRRQIVENKKVVAEEEKFAITPAEQRRLKYLKKSRMQGDRAQMAMERLAKFKAGLQKAKEDPDDWRGHALVCEKDVFVPDATKHIDDAQYEVVDPLADGVKRPRNKREMSDLRKKNRDDRSGKRW